MLQEQRFMIGFINLFVFCLVSACGIAERCVADQPPLVSISALMATPPDSPLINSVVRVRGIISLVGEGITTNKDGSGAENSFVIEEEGVGIWIHSSRALREGELHEPEKVLPGLRREMQVEIEGVLAKLGTPIIIPRRITVLGTAELPLARSAYLKRFLNGADELCRVTAGGVVQGYEDVSQTYWSYRVETGIGYFMTRLPKLPEYAPSRLIDARIRLTGLAASRWNWRLEFTCPRLIVADHQDVAVLKAAKDPFSAPKVLAKHINGYTPSGRPMNRLRVEGVVTYYDGHRLLYIQQAGLGLRVILNQSESIELGDYLEVSGFVERSEYFAGISGASVRNLDHVSIPRPVPKTLENIIDDHNDFELWSRGSIPTTDGQLIQISGRLLRVQRGIEEIPSQLVIDCGSTISTAYVDSGVQDLLVGSELKVTGIARLRYPNPLANVNLQSPEGVDLLPRGPQDIAVLALPSWWTAQRTFWILLFVASLLLSILVWAMVLRRSLRVRTEQLAVEMQSRRDAAIEFQGALRERSRLAANLHDTLMQTMTGIAYQIDACGHADSDSVSQQPDHLETASRMVQYAQEDLRKTVSTLHCLPPDDREFLQSVRQIVERVCLGRTMQVKITATDDFPTLADFVAGNLLLVIQEAIHNALKHAETEQVHLDLTVTSDRRAIEVTIRDHGVGFEVTDRATASEGHFGILGMQQRIERLGGSFAIDSEIGNGTVIVVQAPIHHFDAMIECE